MSICSNWLRASLGVGCVGLGLLMTIAGCMPLRMGEPAGAQNGEEQEEPDAVPSGEEPDDQQGEPAVGAWRLSILGDFLDGGIRQLEPGQNMSLTIADIDIDPRAAVLWVFGDQIDGGRVRVPIWHVFESTKYEDAVGNQLVFQQHIPVMAPGVYTISVGTENEPRSNAVPVEVITPERRMSKEDAARIWSQGLALLASSTREMIENQDGQLVAFRDQVLGPAVLERLGEVFDQLETVSGIAGEEYLALDDEVEKQLQALLHNLGLLPLFEAMLAAEGDVSAKDKLDVRSSILDISPKSPVHSFLFGADILGAALSSVSIVADIANVAAILTGGAGLTVTLPAKLVIAGLQFIIDTILPTQLVSLEVFDQENIGSSGTTTWVYWGLMEPQKGGLEGTFSAAVSVAVAGLGKALPDATDQIASFVQGKLNKIVVQLPFLPFMDFEGDPPFTRVKIIIDMSVYEFSFGTLLEFLPGFTPQLTDLLNRTRARKVLQAAVYDPLTASRIDEGTGEFQDVRVDSYRGTTFGFIIRSGDTPTPDGPLEVRAHPYVFETCNILDARPTDLLALVPGLSGLGTIAEYLARKLDIPNPVLFSYSVPCPALIDEALITTTTIGRNPDGAIEQPVIINKINAGGGVVDHFIGWVGVDTPTDREFTLRLISRFRVSTHVRVVINGEVKTPSLAVSDPVDMAYNFSPGRNEVEITLVDTANEPPMPTRISLVVPDAIPSLGFGNSGELVVGESFTVVIWVPPVLEK